MTTPVMYSYYQATMASKGVNLPEDTVYSVLMKFNIPKELRKKVLKEMEDFELLRKNGDFFTIVNCNIRDDIDELYSKWKRKTIIKTALAA